MSWPWSQLGLPGPSGLPEIRHAYAEKLKVTHPEDDPEGFQRLHSAYQLASRMARQQKRQGAAEPPEPQTERPVPPPRPPKEQEDFDFDELLDEDSEQPRRSREEEERDFDFDELLEEEVEQTRPPEEEEQDFDFDRLFAEGEAERAEERRRRGEERRRMESRERRQQWKSREEQLNLRFRQDEERWQGTEAILHTIEMLYNSRAEGDAWQKFFASPLFQQNKGSLDLVFGLEDFVSTRSLSQEARLALFLAYGFDKGVSRPELRPLYQMLLPAWREKKRLKRHGWNNVLAGLAATAVLFTLLCVSLDHAAFLGAVAMAAVLGFGLAVGWYKTQSGRLGRKKAGLQMVAGMVCIGLTALLMVKGPELWSRAERLLPSSDPREQVCRYLEEDFGEEFRSVYNKNSPDERFSNVFTLEEDPASMFMAGPDGEREDGQPGYTTNYPEMKMLWALKDFAGEREITGVDTVDRNQGLGSWETSGTFLITLPFYGAGDIISELGELLEELSGEKWYQVRTPDCELVLCGRQMEEGRLILTRYRPAEGAFDAGQVRELYESSFGHSYCLQLLKECGLDRNFLQGEDAEPYTMTIGGMAEMKGETCFRLLGLDGSDAVAHEYYVNPSGTVIYCVPGDFWDRGGTEEQISFYRVIHRGSSETPLGIVNLFYPWLTAVQ